MEKKCFFLGDFPGELLRGMSPGLQIDFSFGPSDVMHRRLGHAVLSGEVGGMEGSVSMPRAVNQTHFMRCST